MVAEDYLPYGDGDDEEYEAAGADEGRVGVFGRREREPFIAWPKQEKTCKFCGKTGLFWTEDSSGRWKLSLNGEIHKCPEKPKINHMRKDDIPQSDKDSLEAYIQAHYPEGEIGEWLRHSVSWVWFAACKATRESIKINICYECAEQGRDVSCHWCGGRGFRT